MKFDESKIKLNENEFIREKTLLKRYYFTYQILMTFCILLLVTYSVLFISFNYKFYTNYKKIIKSVYFIFNFSSILDMNIIKILLALLFIIFSCLFILLFIFFIYVILSKVFIHTMQKVGKSC